MGVYAYIPAFQQAEAGRARVQGQLGFQNTKQQQKNPKKIIRVHENYKT
jgi:hypothetical protein